MTRNPYRFYGVILSTAGAILAPIAYFILGSTGIAAIALSAVMIGFTAIALAAARPQVSPEAARLILETGMENVASLLEELGLTNRAIYLPASMREGRAQAVIPLDAGADLGVISAKIPRRLIVRYGGGPRDMAIAVTAPGSTGLAGLDIKPGPTSEEISVAANHVLIGLLDLASSVETRLEGKKLTVEVRGARLSFQNEWYFRSMGSPVASILASIASESLGKPVRIVDETRRGGTALIQIEVLG
jgi:hypothetical protein